MVRRRQPKIDPDVIVTEKDTRKATGHANENEFMIDENQVELSEKDLLVPWATIGENLYKRRKVFGKVNPALNPNQSFRFLDLPAEVRNMIYRYLVVSRSPKPIDLSALRGRFYHAGGIQAAILLANKQIFDEAAKILYDENYCIAVWSKWFDGIAYRVDSPKTKFTTTRSLRSGKTVDMVKYNGIVYKKIFQKLKHVELRVDIDDRIGYCDVHAMRMAAAMKSRLETLEKVLKERQRSNYAGDPSAKHWNLVINSQGILGHTVNYLEFLLSPLLIDDSAPRTLKLGKISVTIKGNWTKNWFKVFEDLRKLSGFSADDIKDVEVGPAVRLTLIEMAWDGYFDGDYRGRLLW